jgi:hypothetical protein
MMFVYEAQLYIVITAKPCAWGTHTPTFRQDDY